MQTEKQPPSVIERNLDELQQGEGGEEEGGGGRGGVEGDREDVHDKVGSTKLNSTNIISTSSTFPARAETIPSLEPSRRLDRIRRPDVFRTQYLSHLGIWANNQARQLTSFPVTEARYKASSRSPAVDARRGLESDSREERQGLVVPPHVPEREAPRPNPQEQGHQQQTTVLPALSGVGNGTDSRDTLPGHQFRDTDVDGNCGGDGGEGVLLIGRDEAKVEQGKGAAGALGGSSKSKGSDTAPGERKARGEDFLPGASASYSATASTAAAAAATVTTGATDVAVPAGGSGGAAPMGGVSLAAGADASGKDAIATPVIPGTQTASSTRPPWKANWTPATPSKAPAKSPPTGSGLESTLSTPLSDSSPLRPRAAAQKSKSSSPPVRAVKPPRRDIRKDYLTNLGLKRAVVAGPGGTRSLPPPMLKRSSLHGGSVENPVEEQLKDPNSGDMKFENLLRVVGSLLTGGGGSKRENESRTCQACERERVLRGSSPRRAFPIRGSCRADDGVEGGGGGDGEHQRKGEGDEGSTGGGRVAASATCRHKHVEFAPRVLTVYIPVHSEYSHRVRRSYWNSAGEIREMVYRNMIEFDAEEYNWEKVAEEEDMYFCEEMGEFIHPVFFDAEEEAREVRAATANEEVCSQYQPIFVSKGRGLPVLERP